MGEGKPSRHQRSALKTRRRSNASLAAAIGGAANGIKIFGTTGTVVNSGTIEATGSFATGIYLYGGGSVTNQAATVAVTVDVNFSAALAGSGQIVLQWQTMPGKRYRIEQRTSIDSASWTALQPDLTAGSSSLSVTNSIGTGSQFYRIVLMD